MVWLLFLKHALLSTEGRNCVGVDAICGDVRVGLATDCFGLIRNSFVCSKGDMLGMSWISSRRHLPLDGDSSLLMNLTREHLPGSESVFVIADKPSRAWGCISLFNDSKKEECLVFSDLKEVNETSNQVVLPERMKYVRIIVLFVK